MTRNCIVIAMVALLASTLAAAGEITHTFVAGDSLGTLASQYYGASWKSVYIAAKNGIANDHEATIGARLVIPTCFTYKVRRGDSVADIAKRYLGDRDRYKALMSENGLRDANELEVGAELLMPFHLRHTIEAGDTWAKIAQRYYRTTRRAGLVKDYNSGSDTLSAGERVTVPIFDRATLDAANRKASASRNSTANGASNGGSVAISKPEIATESPTAATAPRTSMTALRNLLAAAAEDYKKGDFDVARGKLEGLLGDTTLAAPDRAAVVGYLGFCAVALGDRKAAVEYFRKWRELDPKAQLDPITTSPKILSVYQEVIEGEHNEGETH